MGVKREFHLTITEPELGSVLKETDETSGIVTSFIIEQIDEIKSRVTIASEFMSCPGISGCMEKIGTQTITRRIYKEELQLLESYVKSIS